MPRPALRVDRHGDITVRSERPGTWTASTYVRDQDGARRRVRATGATRSAARTALEDKLDERPSFLAQDITPDTTLADLLTKHFDELRSSGKVTAQTLDNYDYLIRRHLIPGVGNLRVMEATTGRLDRFIKTLAAHTPTQARHCRIILKAALGLAVRHDAIATNPVAGTATVAKHKTEIRALDVDEFATLRRRVALWQQGLNPMTGEPEHDNGRPRPADLLDVVDLLAAAGARTGEVLALLWRDVDFDATPPTVTISGTVVPIRGRGYVRQDHPKTDSGWRTVTLPRFAVETLQRLRERQGGDPDDAAPVLPSAAGTLRSPANFRRQWRAARSAAGFDWVTPKTFRKTVATLLDGERSTKAAAAQLGHSGTAVTRQHYIKKAHRAPDNSAILQAFAPPKQSGAAKGA
jgi:integrase